jgi:alkylation response protein AidB-like acyl-CoA dehydrogenase
MDLSLTPRQRQLVDLASQLATERFAPRAEKYDREASFPYEDFDDLREAGLLALCVPEAHGGIGAGFETYCLVAEQIARGNASTALMYNMHCTTMLMVGEIADQMAFPPAVQAAHERRRARRFREVVESSVVYAQPHSEPVELGEADQLRVGGRRFGTRAEQVDGGYLLNGRKFFVSLAGAAGYYATPALLVGDGPWIARTLYLAVPRDAAGVEFQGDWDPMGMRATVSRDMVLTDVFVPEEASLLPPGGFGALYNGWPHGALSFSATFLGLMQAAYDFTIAYLTGRIPGSPGLQTGAPAKGYAVAQMLFSLEAARALFYRSISECSFNPPREVEQRARAAHVTIQRSVVEITAEAIRVCGGRAMLKRYPLERYARDARAAALMRPWTQDIAIQQAWEAELGLGAAGPPPGSAGRAAADAGAAPAPPG